MKYLIITKTKWCKSNFTSLDKSFKIADKYNFKVINKLKPKIIFFLHWSKKIPNKVFKNFVCIQFHSSDLPKFRGGSPIQNQILSGLSKTKITAFKVSERIDQGKICLKEDLSLNGNAQEIFKRMEKICLKMITKIVKSKNLIFKKQVKMLKIYKRRKPSESQIDFNKFKDIKSIYNFIRSTDAKKYPKAFNRYKKFEIEFYNAKIKSNKLYAEIKISKK
jgi:methionyl-tRNA formyltransferase